MENVRAWRSGGKRYLVTQKKTDKEVK